ncbi:flagellin [Sedimentitalea todarodis]|uniref:Flagellin n=1 Tax=Sedimentitalea todarodis TaxID=1631240 RepID=A0ABU3VAF5_9RHOB|nr:flagellin [Sedimentitalea todarodis]MDU9003154.1 flagellin [Sedimentitalea todarodis]
MNMTSIGDLANSIMLRQRSVQLSQNISTLSQELSSGQVSDVSGRLGGDYSYLTDIDRNLARLDGFAVSASEAAMFSGSAQTSLERLHDLSASLSSSLITFDATSTDALREHLAVRAEADIASAISALNASAGGRSLFGGTATDRQPLGTADTLMGELRALVTGLTTAGDVEMAVDTWFADPAGFETAMYQGSDDLLAPIQIGEGEEVSLALTAQDPVFRDTLRDMALAALAGDPDLGFDRATQDNLFRTASEGMLANQDSLTGVRADLGFAEARIEEISARNSAARTSLEYSRAALLEADPFETATRLEEAQFQLESLYTVTVRSANLSLLNFLS